MLVYDANNMSFLKKEIEQVSGKDSGFAQTFYSNKYVDYNMGVVQPFAFDVPMYIMNVGTINYCGQDAASLYTNVVMPSIKFIFTANTTSFGTGTTIIHDIYKIDYPSYQSCINYITGSCKTATLSPPAQGSYTVSNKKNGLSASSEIGYDGIVKAQGYYSGVSLSLEQTQTKVYTIGCEGRGVKVALEQNPGGACKVSGEYNDVKVTITQLYDGSCKISGEYDGSVVELEKVVGITSSLTATSRGISITVVQSGVGVGRVTAEYKGVMVTLDENYTQGNAAIVECHGVKAMLGRGLDGVCNVTGEARGVKVNIIQQPNGACKVSGGLGAVKIVLMQDVGGTCKTPCNIETMTTVPILSLSAQTSGITGANYYLTPQQDFKQLGSLSYQLFEDKSQYFIDTRFSFYRTNSRVYRGDYYTIDEDDKPMLSVYSDVVKEVTQNPRTLITGGTFSGLTVIGKFFSYILVPNKPILEEPYVQGQLDTYSPTFYFSSVDDGDSYLLQVAYEYCVSSAFTGTVYSYPITKQESSLSTREMIGGNNSGDWDDIAEETTDLIRRYSIPIKPKKDFWYRLGNVRTLVNIFGVKQSVSSFSDVFSASTSNYSLSGYVQVASDSTCTDIVPDYVTPNYFEDEPEVTYYLSGTVRGSLVDHALMKLIYPNGSYITQYTSPSGVFQFLGLTQGDYTLNTYYRGYLDDSRTVQIAGNTLLAFKLKLIWGNNADTWGKMYLENYFL